MVDRLKKFLSEMRLLREQKQEFGEVDILPIALSPIARAVTRSLLNDAGMEIDNPDHVQAFLFMLACHVHHDMKPGATPSFPIDGNELVLMAHSAIKNRNKPPNWSDIARKLQKDDRLSGVKMHAIRVHLGRTIDKLLENRSANSSGVETSAVDQALDALRSVRGARGSKSPRNKG